MSDSWDLLKNISFIGSNDNIQINTHACETRASNPLNLMLVSVLIIIVHNNNINDPDYNKHAVTDQHLHAANTCQLLP